MYSTKAQQWKGNGKMCCSHYSDDFPESSLNWIGIKTKEWSNIGTRGVGVYQFQDIALDAMKSNSAIYWKILIVLIILHPE